MDEKRRIQQCNMTIRKQIQLCIFWRVFLFPYLYLLEQFIPEPFEPSPFFLPNMADMTSPKNEQLKKLSKDLSEGLSEWTKYSTFVAGTES